MSALAGSCGFAVTDPSSFATTIGFSGLGAFAVAVAGSESTLFPFFVIAITSVLSLTLSAGIVISPVLESIVTPGLFSIVHVPSFPLLPTTVTFVPSSSL